MMGLTPAEVWAMGATEFAWVCDGYAKAYEDDMLRRAWEMSVIIQVVTGAQHSPRELLGLQAPREVVEPGDEGLVAKLRRAKSRANFHDV